MGTDNQERVFQSVNQVSLRSTDSILTPPAPFYSSPILPNTEYCSPMNWPTWKKVWPLSEDLAYSRPVNMWGPPRWRPANMWGTTSTRGLMLLYWPSCEGLILPFSPTPPPLYSISISTLSNSFSRCPLFIRGTPGAREQLGGETRELGGCLDIVVKIKWIYLREATQKILHTGYTYSLDMCR